MHRTVKETNSTVQSKTVKTLKIILIFELILLATHGGSKLFVAVNNVGARTIENREMRSFL